jgi:hypothetical protein
LPDFKVICPSEGSPVQSETLPEETKVQKHNFLISVVSSLDFKVPSIVTEVYPSKSHAAASKTEVINFP